MTTSNEIINTEEKIKSLEIYINENVNKNLQGEELTKLVNAEESRIFSDDRLKELKVKKNQEENLTFLIGNFNRGIKLLKRTRNFEHITYNYINGFYPEMIKVNYYGKVIELTFMNDIFYIDLKDHCGGVSFNPFLKDEVKDNYKVAQ